MNLLDQQRTSLRKDAGYICTLMLEVVAEAAMVEGALLDI